MVSPCYNGGVAEEIETLSFKVPKSRKRLAKILAAKWNMADMSALMNELLKDAIDSEFDLQMQKALLTDAPDRLPKPRKRAVGE